jgi:hypothetical protein
MPVTASTPHATVVMVAALAALTLQAACAGSAGPGATFADSGAGPWPLSDTAGDGAADVPSAEVGSGCDSDADCSPLYCHPKDAVCVECLINQHCPKGYKCQQNACAKQQGACQSDAECTAAGQVCNPDTGMCADCLDSKDCDGGQYCLKNKCIDWKCTPGSKWCVGTVSKTCNDDGSAITEETDCNDGDLCTVGDACYSGECIETAPQICDDDNPCTGDVCDPASGCHYVFLDVACQDGSPCTEDDHCVAGACVGGTLVCDCISDASCADFEDGDLCNGTLHCIDGKCVVNPFTIPSCPEAGDPCSVVECNPATGQCVGKTLEDGTPCADANACTVEEHCAAGKCSGAAPDCNDSDPCTKDTCDPVAGCLSTPADGLCDDGDACTWPDTCIDGVCIGTQLDCEDGNPCTKNVCVPGTGCQTTTLSGPCEDGSLCTTGDVCTDGVCKGTAVACKDDNPCTDDLCDPAIGCSFVFNKMPCNDGNACTTGDHCSAGECVPGGTLFDCDDNNVCTTDSCVVATGECLHSPNAQPCDDGNPCTEGDVCSLGTCKSGSPKDCDDGNSCTEDFCNSKGECKNEPLAGPCDDGNACTVGDVCIGGKCQPGKPLPCIDDNPCTDESCNPASGCVVTNNTNPCTDNDQCTQTDSCSGGKCVGTSPLTCEDNNPCTADSCSPTAGCLFVPTPAACDDKNACTSGDYCAAGICLAGKPKECNDGNVCTNDSCDSATGCKHVFNGSACDDKQACTFDDVCKDGVCGGGPLEDCDDGNACTQDSCGMDACEHLPASGLCDDGNACTVKDKCDGGACMGQQVDNCGCHSVGLDGATGYAAAPYSAAISAAGPYTFECWWKQSADTGATLISLWSAPGLDQRSRKLEVTKDASLVFHHTDAAKVVTKLSGPIPSTIGWHHAAASYDGATARLYLDGALLASAPAAAPAVAAVPLYIGAGFDPGSNAVKGFLAGFIDEVRISNSALYTAASFVPEPHLVPAAGTLALWGADQVDFKSLFDISGNSAHAWLYGTTSWSNDTAAKVCTPLQNYPPSAPGVAIQPPSPPETADLSCSVSVPSLDMEGDLVSYSYQWLKNGVPQGGQTAQTLSNSLTAPCPPYQCSLCEKWTCQVTPWDGKPGYPGSATTTVGLNQCKQCDGLVYGNHCYKVNPATDYYTAAQVCQAWGGHLATISNKAENDFVASVCGGNGWCWMGLNDIGAEGFWLWINGEPVVFSYWLTGEPNNQGNEDCGSICATCGQVGGWNDAKCTTFLAYVCEKE